MKNNKKKIEFLLIPAIIFLVILIALAIYLKPKITGNVIDGAFCSSDSVCDSGNCDAQLEDGNKYCHQSRDKCILDVYEEMNSGGFICIGASTRAVCREGDWRIENSFCLGGGCTDSKGQQCDDFLQSNKVFYADINSLGGACNDNGPGTINSPWCTFEKAFRADIKPN